VPLFDVIRAVEDQFHRDVIPVLKRRGWRPRVIAYDGYGSAAHTRAIVELGVSDQHRRSWKMPTQATK